MKLLTSSSKFTLASSVGGENRFLFQTSTEAPLPESLECAACLLDSAGRALAELLPQVPGASPISASLHLIQHAVQAAEAIVWAASESDALQGGGA